MNFYKRFIGDIQAKTGGLTLAEFGAYDRLLDHYYSTEEPISPKEAHRICRAMSASERAAVDGVLARFWTLTDSGYTQSKADEVIAKAQPLIEAARANGKKGGRPKKETQAKPAGFSKETQDEPKAKATQSQSQIPSLRSGNEAPIGACPPAADEGRGGGYAVPDCPHAAIVDLYHELLPTLPRLEVLNDTRRGLLRQRWREVCADAKCDREGGLQWWRDYFTFVGQSEFLTGRSKARPGERSFMADLEWLVRPNNFAKVFEGRYHRKEAA